KVPAGHIVSHILKEIHRFFQNVPTGHLGGYFLNVISMYPLDTCWTNCLKNLNVISMYLLVKCPFAPSVHRSRLCVTRCYVWILKGSRRNPRVRKVRGKLRSPAYRTRLHVCHSEAGRIPK